MKLILRCICVVFITAIGYAIWLFAYNPNGSIPTEPASTQTFIGQTAIPKPILGNVVKPHPWLAPQGINSMHNDSHQSDAYSWAGPLGDKPEVRSRQFHKVVGSCVAATWTQQEQMIQTCVTPFGVTLIARDQNTLDVLARKKITNWLPIGQKFSGGVYFHLDHQDRVLLASNDPAIQLWELTGSNDLHWNLHKSIPIRAALDKARQEQHAVIDVMPDWAGNYWFITRDGLVGVSDREGKNIQVVELPNEGIDNALAVGENGVFIVSNHAMYNFKRGDTGAPQAVWRQAYDRGSAAKLGTMGHGSGTTPTLVGDKYVTITDNADGQVNVLVYQQLAVDGDQLVCKQPIFASGRGTSENSISAAGNALIIENNYGYQGPYENITAEPGLARVDIQEDGQGCAIAWENRKISSPSAVPKVSLPNGLIYIYTRDPSNPPDLQAWYFTAVDIHTGKLVFKVLTGIGAGYNNHYGSMSLGQNGTMYLGVLQGLVAVTDQPND